LSSGETKIFGRLLGKEQKYVMEFNWWGLLWSHVGQFPKYQVFYGPPIIEGII